MTSTDTVTLTREEAAYAHLASFKAGDVVDVSGFGYFMPGTIETPQRNGEDGIAAAYVTVRGCGTSVRVTVANLLEDGMTVTLTNEVTRGNVRYFDEAGYAMQNAG